LKNSFIALLNTIGLMSVLVVNYLANALPIGGITTGEASVLYPNLFVPAGLTFSIWGLIYFLWIIVIVKQWRRGSTDQQISGMFGFWFFTTCIFNVAWIFAWHYQWIVVSMIVMVLLLFSLAMMFIRLHCSSEEFDKTPWLPSMALGCYFGWISIATVANFTAILVHFSWGGFGLSPVFWTCTMITIASALGIFMVLKYGDIAFGAVVIWALIGIALKRQMEAAVFYWPAITAFALAGIFFLFVAVFLVSNQKRYYVSLQSKHDATMK
jgi:benzodiazapine receptor